MTTKQEPLKAPFIWFGGKRKVAAQVWDALGDVDNYAEPFAGSLAVLLGRPDDHAGRCETVNDADCFLANFWRALEHAPDETAFYTDRPVNECDLIAIHTWLVNTGRERIQSLESDPNFYDAQVAGWWVWGLNAWIGSGWCSGKGPWQLIDGRLEDVRQRPHLGDAGQGVNRQRPHLGDAGQGVNRQLPAMTKGYPVARFCPESLQEYFRELAARLRLVRVCCGDWSRVVTNGALSFGETVGIFLDPPYLGDVRTKDLYAVEDHTIANEVREWCLANGDNPRYRIVLAGYAAEHDEQMPESWRRYRYSANKAYGTTAAVGKKQGNDANRHNEVLWFSPHCLRPSRERSLFDV